MKKLLMLLVLCLIPLSWIQSQDTTSDRVSIDAKLIPYWYVTIIQLERSEIIIDSLRTAYKDCLNTSLYYNAQNQNLQNQKSELEKLVKNITSQNNINSDGLGQCEFKLKRWKNVAKVSIGIAAIFGTVAVLR